jgi:8-oxo-dGTP pyrophosphatase MutT (NUDIX family)
VTYASVRESVLETLSRWQPPDPDQDSLREAVLAFVLARPDACRRTCEPGHITASALLFDHTGSRVLLTLHPRLSRWVQLGGHCEDEDLDIVAAARREALEESGIEESGAAVLKIDPTPAAMHVHALTCSLGVPTRHLDVQFICQAPRNAEIERSDESLDLRWWPADALPDNSDHALAQLVTFARQRMAAHTSVE